jgi:hypothetical protein
VPFSVSDATSFTQVCLCKLRLYRSLIRVKGRLSVRSLLVQRLANAAQMSAKMWMLVFNGWYVRLMRPLSHCRRSCSSKQQIGILTEPGERTANELATLSLSLYDSTGIVYIDEVTPFL